MKALLITFMMALLPGTLLGDEVDIDVLGLFKDAALLKINGEQRLLKEGDTTREGVTLLSADSREAIIELDGRQLRLDLSSHIGAQFQPPGNSIVTIAVDDLGQYRTPGSINDRPVSFLVDTGANIVALNATHARNLGLDYENGVRTRATTAGGFVETWAVTLDSIQVGDIKVTNVRAAVLEGDFPQEILLGMSFLTSVEMKEVGGVLVLTARL